MMRTRRRIRLNASNTRVADEEFLKVMERKSLQQLVSERLTEAATLSARGKHMEAIEVLSERAVPLCGHSDPFLFTELGKVHASIAKCKQAMGSKIEDVISSYETALENFRKVSSSSSSSSSQNEAKVIDELAPLYISKQHPEKALKLLERKVEIVEDKDERAALIARVTSMRAKALNVPIDSAHILGISVSHSETSTLERRIRKAEMDVRRGKELVQLGFRDINFDDITQRANDGHYTLGQLHALFRAQAEADEKLSRSLAGSLKDDFFGRKAHFKENGTLQQSLSAYTMHMKERARAHSQYSSSITNDVCKSIDVGRMTFSKLAKKLSADAQSAVRRKNACQDNLSSARLKLMRTMKQLEVLRGQINDDPNNVKLSSLHQKHLRSREELGSAVQRCEAELEIVMGECRQTMQRVADDFQEYELSRTRKLKEELMGLIEDEERMLERQKLSLERCKRFVEEIDATSDVRLFSHERRVVNMFQGKVAELAKSSGRRSVERSASPVHRDDLDQNTDAYRAMERVIEGIYRGGERPDDFEKVHELLRDAENRKAFVQLLNLERSRQQEVGKGFDLLAELMDSFLDSCVRENDVKAAKMLMIMSETFYAMDREGHEGERIYMQVRIKEHPIWSNLHFWEEALLLAAREEVEKTLERMERPSEADFNVAYQNICFGQLGSYALNLQNFGVSQHDTEEFIKKMSFLLHLKPQMLSMLIENSRATAAKEET
eukprot:g765.t1